MYGNQIRELCVKRLPNYYKVDPIDDIQVLCPMQRGITGAANMNRVLQEALNKESRYIKYGGSTASGAIAIQMPIR